jgi:hypothetical protein
MQSCKCTVVCEKHRFLKSLADRKLAIGSCCLNCGVPKKTTCFLPAEFHPHERGEVIRRADPNKMMKKGLRISGIAYLYSTTTRGCVA